MKVEEEVFQLGYRVLEDGILVDQEGKFLLPYMNNGYWKKQIKGKCFHIHRLVAYMKFGDALFEDGVQVRHLDGNRGNNSFDNIAIGTARDNMMDMPQDQRVKKAVKGARVLRKLTYEEANKLREDRGADMTYKQLMEKYGIAKSTVSYIVNEKTYMTFP